MTWQNKHPHNQDKTILRDDMTKQTPAQSRQNNITRLHVKNKHPHNQDKNNITRLHVKNKHPHNQDETIFSRFTCQNKHPHNQDKAIFQDHMSKQTPTQWRQNNNTRSHVKTNTSTIKTK